MIKKILITYTNYGTGHQRAAEALLEKIKANYPDVVAECMDVLTYSRPKMNNIFKRIGKIMATTFSDLRNEIYKRNMYKNYDKNSVFASMGNDLFWTDKLKRKLEKFNADLIISTQVGPTSIIASNRHKIGNPKIAVVFTDYGLHKWYVIPHKNVEYFFVPTKEVKEQMISVGVNKNKIYITGIPVSCDFNVEKYKRRKTLRRYRLKSKIPIILFVVGGGEGYSNAFDYFEELLNVEESFSYIFISGRSVEVRKKAAMIANKYNKRGIVLGYVTNMAELINASDIVVGKPGGLLTTECVEMNTPFYAIEPIPGQELKNVSFLLNMRFGLYSKSKSDFYNDITIILKNKSAIKNMKKRMEKYDIKDGTKKILEILLG